MPNSPTRVPKRLVSSNLVNFAAARPEDFVRLCEGEYDARIARVAAAVLDSGCAVVLLTGPSSSGKTTSANRLARAVRAAGRRSEVISLDDFFVGEGRYPKRPDGEDDYECVEALDIPLLQACLRDLAETGECDMPQFDFLTQLPRAERRHVDCRDGVAVIEGLHAFNPVLTDHLPRSAVLLVYAGMREEYCDASGARALATRDLRLARRITRDYLFRGHDAGFTLNLWPHVIHSENRYIKVFKDRADLVLDTSFSYEPGLWRTELLPMVQRMGPGVPHSARLASLCAQLRPFAPVSRQLVPQQSILREFIGPDPVNAPETGKN